MFPQPLFISNTLDYYNQVQSTCIYVVNQPIPPYELVYPNHHYQVVPPYFAHENQPNPRELQRPPPPRTSLSRPRRSREAPKTTSPVWKWVPKREVEQSASISEIRTRNIDEDSSSTSQLIPFPTNPNELIASNTTTLMIKNIPNQFGYYSIGKFYDTLSRNELLGILKDHCLEDNLKFVLRSEPTMKSEFDFFYLPMDFDEYWKKREISNLGYGFVNFTSCVAALRFYEKFHKFEWPVRHNKKTCEVVCAQIQGKKALRKSLKNKVFWCHSIEYLPVILEPPCDGVKYPRLVPVGILSGKPKIRNQ